MAFFPLIESIINKLRLRARFYVEAYHQLSPIFSKLSTLECLRCMALRYSCHPLSAETQYWIDRMVSVGMDSR